MNIWEHAKLQTDKDIQTFRDVVKPKLERFYKQVNI